MIVAVHHETGAWLEPKPNTGSRDRDGHFIGCQYPPWGCSTTRCRDGITAEVRAAFMQHTYLWKRF